MIDQSYMDAPWIVPLQRCSAVPAHHDRLPGHPELLLARTETEATPRRPYGLAVRFMAWSLDRVYGVGQMHRRYVTRATRPGRHEVSGVTASESWAWTAPVDTHGGKVARCYRLAVGRAGNGQQENGDA